MPYPIQPVLLYSALLVIQGSSRRLPTCFRNNRILQFTIEAIKPTSYYAETPLCTVNQGIQVPSGTFCSKLVPWVRPLFTSPSWALGPTV